MSAQALPHPSPALVAAFKKGQKAEKKKEQRHKPARPVRAPKARAELRSVGNGLSVGKRQNRPQDRESWLKSVNPYYASLRDPVGVDNARIPDPTTTPSSVFRIIQKGEFTASATGYAAITFGGCGSNASAVNARQMFQSMLVPTSTKNMANTGVVSTGYNNWCSGFLSSASCVEDDLMLANTALSFNGWHDVGTTVPNTFSKVRLVSACLTVIPTGTAIGSSGRIVGVSLSRCDTLRDGSASITSNEIENKPGATSVAINSNKPLNVLYAPQDAISHSYAVLPGSGNGEGTLVFPNAMTSGTAYMPAGGFASEDDLWVHSPGELWALIIGAQSGQPFSYVFTGNYEAIPRTAQSCLVPAHVSHSDPIAMATAMNSVANSPRVESGSELITQTVAASISGPKMSLKRPEKPMLDRILETVGKVGGFAAKFAPLALAAL